MLILIQISRNFVVKDPVDKGVSIGSDNDDQMIIIILDLFSVTYQGSRWQNYQLVGQGTWMDVASKRPDPGSRTPGYVQAYKYNRSCMNISVNKIDF